MAVLVLLLAVVVALLGVLVAGLLRSHAEILRALHELGVSLDPDRAGTRAGAGAPGLDLRRPRPEARPAADLAGVTPNGDAISVSVVDVDHLTLVAFLTSGCTTCAGFWTAFSDDRLRVPGDARIVVATKGVEAESPTRLGKFAPPNVPVVMSSDAWTAFDVPVAPYFALVDGPNGQVIGEGAAMTWENLRSMLEQALEDAGIAPGRRRGRPRRRRPAVDDELADVGLEPGDPRLHPQSAADLQADPPAS